MSCRRGVSARSNGGFAAFAPMNQDFLDLLRACVVADVRFSSSEHMHSRSTVGHARRAIWISGSRRHPRMLRASCAAWLHSARR